MLASPVASVVSQAAEEEAAGAAAHVRAVTRQAIDILTTTTISERERLDAFRDLLVNAAFDLPYLARFVLGRYRKRYSPAERENFETAFQDYIIAAYTSLFRKYFSGDLQVLANRVLGGEVTAEDLTSNLKRLQSELDKIEWAVAGDERHVYLDTRIDLEKGEPLRVQWRLLRRGDWYRIVDVEIKGVSLAVMHRSDLQSVLRRNNGRIERLIDILERKAAQLRRAP
ncbi:MAG: phospholipid-binding protein MlaC [Kiloniellales bacterium]